MNNDHHALQDLVLFVEVARTCSFSQSALNLGLSAATLSRRIRALIGPMLPTFAKRYPGITFSRDLSSHLPGNGGHAVCASGLGIARMHLYWWRGKGGPLDATEPRIAMLDCGLLKPVTESPRQGVRRARRPHGRGPPADCPACQYWQGPCWHRAACAIRSAWH